MNISALFPGQGSQVVGMGKDFFEVSDEARSVFSKADRALGFSISKLCFDGPIEELTLTKNAQPAILTASYVCFLEFKKRFPNANIICSAGHSLGEYTALVAAGVISFEDAVLLVHKRGTYMQEAVPEGTGGMVALLGPTEEEIRVLLSDIGDGIAEIANLNCPGQTVVAGDNQGIQNFSAKAAEKGWKVIPLKVSAPFHCSLMKPAAENLKKDLEAINFNNPQFPIYSNVKAQEINSGNEARELLYQQVCSSVRWTESVVNMIKLTPESFVEFGSGSVFECIL